MENKLIHHQDALKNALAALQLNNMDVAIQYMQLAADLAPENAMYRRNVGELLRRVGRLAEAVTSLQIAARLEPQCAENYFLLGLVFNDDRQYEVAIRYYHIALSYDQHNGLVWNNLGASLENSGDKKHAKIAYSTAIALNAQHAEAQNNLGAIYSEEGHLEKARYHFEAAIQANPELVDAHYNLSLLKNYSLDDPRLALLESMANKIQQHSIHHRIRYYFALGKALDHSQQFKRAFEAYAAGNDLQNQLQPWDATKLKEIVSQLPSVFNQLSRAENYLDKRCPIFIVGMPRAGTTLIEQILSSHHNIYGAGELSILDDVIQEACRAANLRFIDWASQLSDSACLALGQEYLQRTWRLAPDKDFIVDKMPGNCFYIGMIYRMLPNAKIIHAIRDPMDSCFSCYTHLFKSSMDFAYDQTSLGIYYSLYAQAMQHWHAVLPANTMFNLAYEDMVTNHEVLSKALIDYIGLTWDPNCLNFHENTRLVKTASLSQVRKPIYKTSVQRWRNFTNELAPLMKLVAPYRNIKGISA